MNKNRKTIKRMVATATAMTMAASITMTPPLMALATGPIKYSDMQIKEKTGVMEDEYSVATSSNAKGVATASNALFRAASDIWLGISMSESLNGEGTEESPYLISSMDDLRYLAYNTSCNDAVDGFSGMYFKLTKNLAHESGSTWLPIGYYQDSNDELPKAFSGYFDGDGYTISNLSISNTNQTYAGLFGHTQGAEIRNLTVRGTVSAYDKAAMVIGVAYNTIVEDCTSGGTVKGAGVIGGIVGEMYDSSLRDCVNNASIVGGTAEDLVTYVGGIAGAIHSSIITNCESSTSTSYANIYSEGYAGGIVGDMESSGVYNCYVNGIIGNSNTDYIGGIVGRFQSGEVKVNRFAGTIGHSSSSYGKQSGLFIGNITNSNVSLGNNISYLYAAGEDKYSVLPFGNLLNNSIRTNHHIGAYKSNGNTFSLYNQGQFIEQAADDYFYQELETGVLSIDNEYLHHWASDTDGKPVTGYLVTVPSVENGTLSVKEANNYYAKSINFANPGAIAKGRTVMVTTFPEDESIHYLQDGSLRYYMNGNVLSSKEITGGNFIMPEGNLTVTATYLVKTQGITIDKKNMDFTVEMVRSGDRTNPHVEYKVTDPQRLVATILPEDAHDKSVKWAVRDGNYSNVTDALSVNGGIVEVNSQAEWIQELIAEAVAKQEINPSEPIVLEKKSNAYVTATNSAGDIDSCYVTINFIVTDETKVPVFDVQLNKEEISFEVVTTLTGDRLAPIDATVYKEPVSHELEVSINPTYTDIESISWNSDMAIISILPDGKKAMANINSSSSWFGNNLNAVKNRGGTNNRYAPYLDDEGNELSYEINPTISVAVEDEFGNVETRYCKVKITHHIIDETKVFVEDITIDQDDLDFTIERILTGSILNPNVRYIVTDSKNLTYTINPEVADDMSATWVESPQGAGVLYITPNGTLSVNQNADWIKELLDSEILTRDKYERYTAHGEYKDAYVVVTANDSTNGVKSDYKKVGINFYTTDDTVTYVEDIQIDKDSINLIIEKRLTGSRINPTIEYVILDGNGNPVEGQQLSDGHRSISGLLKTTILPATADNQKHTWATTNGDIIEVDQNGNYVIRTDAQWIQELEKVDVANSDKYAVKAAEGNITALITAITEDKGVNDEVSPAECTVNINFKTIDSTVVYVEDLLLEKEELVFNISGTKKGSNTTFSVKDANGNILTDEFTQELVAVVNPTKAYLSTVTYRSANPKLITVQNDGTVKLNLDDEWISTVINNKTTKASNKVVVTITTDGTNEGGTSLTKEAEVTINLTMSYSSTGSSGGSSGSGSGSSSSTSGSPSVSVTWKNDASGWTLSSKVYSNWKVIDGKWYFFNQNGYMITGWQEWNGNKYYLDTPDGAMVTGWNYIDGVWYYFNAEGALQDISFQSYEYASDGGSWVATAQGWKFRLNGGYAQGWKLINGKWHYFSIDGVMQAGMIDDAGKSYILNKGNGHMSAGWMLHNGEWYYAGQDGSLLKNTSTADGYNLDANGRWLK